MTESLLSSLHKVLDTPHALVPRSTTQTNMFDRDPYDSVDDMYSYSYGRPYHREYSATKPTLGYSKPYASKKVIVVGPDNTEQPYTVPFDCDGWFDIAKDVWPTVDSTMRVPLSACTFSYGEPKFNACVFMATNDYMQARWGRKLDESDRRWLASHPLSTDNGVPQEYTATCVDQMVQPYGMRVSRVRLRKGSLVLGDSIMAWVQALGCNPFALADRATSNAEAAERMGIALEQANALWRVEFSEDPFPCSIVGERGWTNTTGVSTGSFGGHARYLAPRALGGDWFISVQLDLDTNVSHLVPPPNPDYVPRTGAPTLLLSEIVGPGGGRIAERIDGKWVAVGAPADSGSNTTVAPSALPTHVDDDMFDEVKPACLFCNDASLTLNDLMVEADVCHYCLEDAWFDYSCTHCGVEFRTVGPPFPVAADSTSYDWECPSCKGIVTVPVNGADDYLLNEVCYTIFHNLRSADTMADYVTPAHDESILS
jgi:hypothetical protein